MLALRTQIVDSIKLLQTPTLQAQILDMAKLLQMPALPRLLDTVKPPQLPTLQAQVVDMAKLLEMPVLHSQIVDAVKLLQVPTLQTQILDTVKLLKMPTFQSQILDTVKLLEMPTFKSRILDTVKASLTLPTFEADVRRGLNALVERSPWSFDADAVDNTLAELRQPTETPLPEAEPDLELAAWPMARLAAGLLTAVLVVPTLRDAVLDAGGDLLSTIAFVLAMLGEVSEASPATRGLVILLGLVTGVMAISGSNSRRS